MFHGGNNEFGLASINVKEYKGTKKRDVHPQTSFFDRLDTAKRRTPAERVVAQIMIRLKYLALSWFGMVPIFW